MKQYFQGDYLEQLGNCPNQTIKSAGCFITSLGMICGLEPPMVNQILKNGGGYVNGCDVESVKSAELLGLDYLGKVYEKPDYDCIIETNYYAPKVRQHFCVLTKDGKILDPLGKNINYPIVSYRLFKRKEVMNWEQIINAIRYVRLLSGQVDDKGANADATLVQQQFANGQDDALGQCLQRILTAPASSLIDKKKCPVCPPVKVCPPLPDMSLYIKKTDIPKCPPSAEDLLAEFRKLV